MKGWMNEPVAVLRDSSLLLPTTYVSGFIYDRYISVGVLGDKDTIMDILPIQGWMWEME